MNEYSSRSNCSMVECFPEKLKWPWNEQVCQGVKCKVCQGVKCKVCQGVKCKVCQGVK